MGRHRWEELKILIGFGVGCLVLWAAGIANADLVAHWALDDGQADPDTLTATDSVSPAVNGVWTQTTGGGPIPRWVSGALGGAAHFGGMGATTNSSIGPGTDDVILIDAAPPPTTKLDITGALTLSAWILHEEFGSPSSTRHIAGKDRAGGQLEDAYSLKHNMSGDANTLQFMVASGGENTNLTSVLTLPEYTLVSQNGGWVHLAGVFEPGQYMRLYIDGVLDNELTVDVPTSIDSFPQTPFTIGRLHNSNQHSFNGQIDDVQVYGQALSGGQISSLFANPGASVTGVTAHWALDDGQSDPFTFTATDSVAPPLHAIWQNVTTPRWTTGIAGGAAEFGGPASPPGDRDDVIAVVPEQEGSKLDITGALSLAAWIQYEELGGRNSTRHIAGKDRAGGPLEDAYSLKHNMASGETNNKLQFLIASDGVNTNVSSEHTLPVYTEASQRGGWIHVAGVFQPNEYMRLYIDGVLDIELTDNVPSAIDFFPQTPFTIGRLHNSDTHSFNGAIDDVRLYNHALTLAEIEALVAMVPPFVGVPGDFNNDGVVDAADYVFWRDNLGGSQPLTNDGNLGTPIGEDHYALWRSNFGQAASSAALDAPAVPEPPAIGLVLLALVGLVSRRTWSRG